MRLRRHRCRQHLGGVLVLLGLAATTTGPAGAGTTAVSVILTSGTLSVTADDISFEAFTLNGTDQVTTATASWTAVDARGTGLGWNVTVISTDMTSTEQPGRIIDISQIDQEFRVQIPSSAIATLAGNTAPTTRVPSPTAIPSTTDSALKVISAAVDDGMGTYMLSPTFTLEVPAEQYSGTYNGTAVVTMTSAP